MLVKHTARPVIENDVDHLANHRLPCSGGTLHGQVLWRHLHAILEHAERQAIAIRGGFGGIRTKRQTQHRRCRRVHGDLATERVLRNENPNGECVEQSFQLLDPVAEVIIQSRDLIFCGLQIGDVDGNPTDEPRRARSIGNGELADQRVSGPTIP